jgi:sulfur-carrier protein
MAVDVHIPSLIRHLFQTEPVEQVEAANIFELIERLDERYPGIKERLIEPDGSLRRYVNIFAAMAEGRIQVESQTKLAENGEVWIVPNVAGG